MTVQNYRPYFVVAKQVDNAHRNFFLGKPGTKTYWPLCLLILKLRSYALFDPFIIFSTQNPSTLFGIEPMVAIMVRTRAVVALTARLFTSYVEFLYE